MTGVSVLSFILEGSYKMNTERASRRGVYFQEDLGDEIPALP